MDRSKIKMDDIIALCKNRGFIYPGSEIYGGLANTWDYGNLGVELKNNVKKAWWKKFVEGSKYNVGVDCALRPGSLRDTLPDFRIPLWTAASAMRDSVRTSL